MNENPQLSPALMLRRFAFVMRVSRALYAAAELGLADILAGGPMTNDELATKVEVDPGAMRRLMRALVAHGIFEELEVGRCRLNAAGELLRRNVPGSQRAGVIFTAGAMRWELWSDFLACVRTGQAAIERTFGQTVFERHAQNPEELALFREAMAGFAAALSQPLMAAYDFGAFERIADIGGGSGQLLMDILAAHPKTHGLLFDLPKVVAAAPERLAERSLEARCEVVGGSFFDGVPPGADAYVMRAILHDWDDDRAVAILTNVRKVMGADARLIVIERVLPEKAKEGVEADSYLLDLEMLVNTPGGRERTATEFDAILTEAGFLSIRVLPTATSTSLIEARWV
jgi:hypothetical protein